MKKLLSILLAIAMIGTLLLSALPAMAEATTYDVQITSDIRLDEMYHTADGYYMWTEYGHFDATVAGNELTDVTISELRWAIYEAYQLDLYDGYSDGGQNDRTWAAGSKYPVTIDFMQDGAAVISLSPNVAIHETKIESLSVDPITLYAGAAYYKDIVIRTNYKDGTVEKALGGYMRDWEWPTEIGTYEEKIYLHWGYEIPVTINVVAVPTSGKCGDNLTWTYDESTKTLTISGTGAMYEIAADLDTFWEYDYNYEPEFWYCGAENIIVEEGVTYLPNFAFGWLEQKTLQLPSTLQALPTMWLTASLEMKSLTIPEGITSLTGWPFGSPGNSFCSLKEIYIPASMKKIDMYTLLLGCIDMNDGGLSVETIYYGGSPSQWDAIEWVRTDFSEIFGEDYDGFINDDVYAQAAEFFKQIPIVYAKKDVPVEDGVATLPEESVEITDGEDVVIDVTGTVEKAESVIISTQIVEKITNADTNVEIKLPDAVVSFDKTAIGSISQQAGTESVTIVAKEVESSSLNNKQVAALEKEEVLAYLSLEAHAGETKITEFGGGKVTISVPFELPAGKQGKNYSVAYVADDGKITIMPTTYTDGKLTFETTHFSNYVVLEAVSDSPNTGDGTAVVFFAVMLLASAACLATCVLKRKAI